MWTKNKKKKDNRGTSMITVIISFALLLIFVAGYFKVQRVSQNIMMDAKDLLMNNRELIRSYYLGETENTSEMQDAYLTFSGENGKFYINASLYRAQKEGLTGTLFYFADAEE